MIILKNPTNQKEKFKIKRSIFYFLCLILLTSSQRHPDQLFNLSTRYLFMI